MKMRMNPKGILYESNTSESTCCTENELKENMKEIVFAYF